MPRPMAKPEQYLRAYRLYRQGRGHKEIFNAVLNEFGEENAASERTISVWIQKFKEVHPEAVDLDSPFEWRRMDKYGLPWEGSAFILAMLKDVIYSHAWDVQYGPNSMVPVNTTARDVVWWWRIGQGCPEIPEVVGTLRDIQQLAAKFTFREMTHELLATPMETADLEALLALKPWLDADHHRRYHWAVDLGVATAIHTPESSEISRAIVAGMQEQGEPHNWLHGGSFGILKGHSELLNSQQMAIVRMYQKVFIGEEVTDDEIENVLWAATPAKENNQ